MQISKEGRQDMSNESTRKTVQTALGVCLVCSILVSTTAVSLKRKQKQNQEIDMMKNILMVGNLDYTKSSIVETFRKNIHPEWIDLETGKTVSKDSLRNQIVSEICNIKEMIKNEKNTIPITPEEDIANIRKKLRFITIYQIVQNQTIQKYILPVYGKGLWSTLYGFIALDKDLKTIRGLTFYDHGETPGLGGEVDNPRWKSLWVGKQAYDEEGQLRIEVIKGKVDSEKDQAKYEVDGLTGSTLTTRGVNHLVRFWLGNNGYAPYLDRLRKG